MDSKKSQSVEYRSPFIPQESVGGFRGDNRRFPAAEPQCKFACFCHTVRIETDPAKNGGHPLIGKPEVVVQSTHIEGWHPESMNKFSSGPVIPESNGHTR